MQKEGDEKFHEIDEDRFDDSENKYFQFPSDDEDDEMLPDYDEDFFDSVLGMTDMFSGIVNQLISMLPDEMHEYGRIALEAIFASGKGDYKESNKLLHKLKKFDDFKAGSGVDLLEGNNYSDEANAILRETGNPDRVQSLLKKAKKSFMRYIDRYDENCSLSEYNDYLFARAEKARAGLLTGDGKGVFSSALWLSENADFDILRVMNALEEYFLPPDDEEDSFYSDSFYLFETEADSVVSIRYQANNFNDIADEIPEALKDEFVRSGYNGNGGCIQILVDGEPFSAAYDMQLVLTALFHEYGDDVSSIRIGEELFPLSAKDSIIEDTAEDIDSSVVFLQIGCTHYNDTCVYVLRTHSGLSWGRKDVAIELKHEPLQKDYAAVYNAMARNIKRALKDGDIINSNDAGYKVYTSTDRGEELFFLKEE